MGDISAEATITAPPARHVAPARQTSTHVYFALVAGAAFGLYWFSSYILLSRAATMHFGVDTEGYTEFAQGDVLRRMVNTYDLDRIIRFHLTTATLAVAWMKILSPFTRWIAPLYLLKALFALIGATGVWIAMSAFARVMARRDAILFGIIYAVSFSVWYFSSIEESKMVSGMLAGLYIASYLRLREEWTTRGAILQTAILLFACMNEMVAGFLIIIPIVDTLMQHGLNWRQGRWIAAHAVVGPVALVILEGFAYCFLTPASHPEGASHLSMLIYYVSQSYHGADMLYLFVLNWLFFMIAAPTANAPLWAPPGFFEPALSNYFASPVSALLVTLFLAMVAVSVMNRGRIESPGSPAGILLGLMTYSLLRGCFFFVFDPPEPILFSSSVTLVHMLMIGILFAASNVPAKRTLLAAFAVLLFATNQAFIIGW